MKVEETKSLYLKWNQQNHLAAFNIWEFESQRTPLSKEKKKTHFSISIELFQTKATATKII